MDVEVFYKRRGKLFDRQQSFFFFSLGRPFSVKVCDRTNRSTRGQHVRMKRTLIGMRTQYLQGENSFMFWLIELRSSIV